MLPGKAAWLRPSLYLYSLFCHDNWMWSGHCNFACACLSFRKHHDPSIVSKLFQNCGWRCSSRQAPTNSWSCNICEIIVAKLREGGLRMTQSWDAAQSSCVCKCEVASAVKSELVQGRQRRCNRAIQRFLQLNSEWPENWHQDHQWWNDLRKKKLLQIMINMTIQWYVYHGRNCGFLHHIASHYTVCWHLICPTFNILARK
jgi:hypothetical protein